MPRVQDPAGVTTEDLYKCSKPWVHAFSGQPVKRNFKAFQDQAILLCLTPFIVRGIYFSPSHPLQGARMLQSQPGQCRSLCWGSLLEERVLGVVLFLLFFFSLQLCFAAAQPWCLFVKL